MFFGRLAILVGLPTLFFYIMGLIDGLFGFGNNKRTNKTNLKIAQETNAANLWLARKQNEWNIEQWNRQNEYNSPAHQRDLLLEAGYNPNLYGGDGATAGQLVSAPLANQEAATLNPLPAGLFGSLDDILDPLRLELEKKRLESDIKKADAEVKKTGAETEKLYQDISQAKEIYPYLKSTAEWQSYSARSQATVDDATTQYRIAELYLDNKAKEAVIKLTREQISQVRHQCALIAAQTDGQRKDNMFKDLELQFSRQFGLPLDSSSGRMLLDYICSNYKTQTHIKGELSGGLMVGSVGIKAGAGADHQNFGFNAQKFFNTWSR